MFVVYINDIILDMVYILVMFCSWKYFINRKL